MTKKQWVVVVIVAIIFAGAGFWGGMSYAQNQAAAARSQFAGGNFAGRTGGAGGFTGRAGGAGGGATFGSIVAISPNSITIQLASATSTSSASTGSKIVLYDSSTQISELESVPASNLAMGQTVTVTGTANADGSVTATSIQVLPAGMRRGGTSGGAAPTSGQ